MAAIQRCRTSAADDILPTIRAGYATGTPIAEIAKQLGVTRNVVIGKAWRAGLEHPHPCNRTIKIKTATRDIAIAKCVVSGIPVRAMAAIHDVRTEQIRAMVRKYCQCITKGNRRQPSIWRWRDEQSSAGA